MITAYVNGEFLQEATISPFDLGFLRGYGVFEYFRTHERRPLFLQQRLERLSQSAKSIGISFNQTHEELETIIYHLIENNGFVESTVRIILTKGMTDDGFTPVRENSLIILTSPFSPYPNRYYEEGIFAITTKQQRAFPHVKTLNYLPAFMALEEAKQKGAKVALYINMKGEILEGTSSNFFGIKGEKLFTAEENILPGITRDVLLRAAKSRFEIVRQPIHIEEISLLDEAFLTSSIKEVVPVVNIDQQQVGKGKPGPHTKKLIQLFRNVSIKLTLN